MLPLQLFLAVFALGVWWGMPKIEKDLTSRTTTILREMGLDGKVRLVRFEGPVATLAGTVTDAGIRETLIARIESLEPLWGLRVHNPQAIQIVRPSTPVSYRLDFALREIKLTGNLPGELEKKSLNRKLRLLFPKAKIQDLSTIVINTDVATMSLNLLEHLRDLQRFSQLRWVTMDNGQLAVSANLAGEGVRQAFLDTLTTIGPNVRPADLHIISPPRFGMKFSSGSRITLEGRLATQDDQNLATDFVKGLFPKMKVDGVFEFDEQLGPIEWIFPKLEALPGLQKLGTLTRFESAEGLPVVEAATQNASSRFTMIKAIEDAYGKEVTAKVNIAKPLVTSTQFPVFWAELGEDVTPIDITVMNEADKVMVMEKLAILFPKTTFQPTVTFKPKLAPARIYLPLLDPLAEISNIDPDFLLRGFGLVDGKLKVKGIVPDEATKDRFSGLLLRQYSGRVSTDLTIDQTYQLSPNAYWAVTFSPGAMTIKGQVNSKLLSSNLEEDLSEIYPGLKAENALEIIPSGLRPGRWKELLTGVTLVAAPEQTIQVAWNKDRLTLSARVPSESAREAMENRLKKTYGKMIHAQIETVPDSALADQPSVSLVDCTIYIKAGQQDFMKDNLPKLELVHDLMLNHPELKISIESHTDAKGPFNANLNTSLARANTIAQWLSRRGIATDRLMPRGFGPRRPVADMKTDAGRDANRRIEFRVHIAPLPLAP